MPYADPEAQRAYFKQYDQTRKAKRAARRPFDDRVKHANDRARRHGVEGTITLADVHAVLAPGAVCEICGTKRRLTLDHVVPMALGGPNVRANLQPLCLNCNARKANKLSIDQWTSGHEACLDCGETQRRHAARGLCRRCYQRRPRGC